MDWLYDYATVHGLADHNPAQPVGKQIPAQKVKHRAAVTEPKDIGRLLRDIHNYHGTFVVQCAFRLSPLVFQRPGEIRQMLKVKRIYQRQGLEEEQAEAWQALGERLNLLVNMDATNVAILRQHN